MAAAEDVPITVQTPETTEIPNQESTTVIRDQPNTDTEPERIIQNTANVDEQKLESNPEVSSNVDSKKSIVLTVPKTVTKKRDRGIYIKSLITKKVSLPIQMIGNNIK